ncbi:MAG: chromosome segregation protein SMC, partial [Bacteroidota bacterium]
VPAIIGGKVENFEAMVAEINETHRELMLTNSTLVTLAKSISYKTIYSAVLELGKVSKVECPACKTPISNTVHNPYELAQTEILKLAEVDKIQEHQKDLEQSERDLFINLSRYVTNAVDSLEEKERKHVRENILKPMNWDWLESLQSVVSGEKTNYQILLDVFYSVEKRDQQLTIQNGLRSDKEARLLALRELKGQHQALSGSRDTIEASIKTSQKIINEFEATNADLIRGIEAEKDEVSTNIQISNAYQAFVSKLNAYKDELPAALVANLGHIVVELYNSFNRNDDHGDKLKSIKLPASAGDRIEIEFQGNPNVFQDALHILSEGHIRCVGLSILLAKNLQEKCPILIFDDPVNAIDNEHREAIRATIFEEAMIKDSQIILTCHGEEFFKDIQAYMPVEKAKAIHLYTFLPKNGENHIQVNFETKPRNYILVANESIRKGEVRDSLMSCRRALEAMNIRLWEYSRKNNGGSISISFRQHNKPWDTRSLTEKLKSSIGRPGFVGQAKDDIIKHLDLLLGVSGESREWRYLNKGTHEEVDRDEFDRNTAKLLIDAITEIDKILPPPATSK